MNKTDHSSKRKSQDELPMEELEIGGAIYKTRLTSKFRNREKWIRPDQRKIEAIIPGTIREIMVVEGSEVTQGTPLLILEAMKMNNKVLSPMDGIIKKIHVSEGDLVSKSHLLLEFK